MFCSLGFSQTPVGQAYYTDEVIDIMWPRLTVWPYSTAIYQDDGADILRAKNDFLANPSKDDFDYFDGTVGVVPTGDINNPVPQNGVTDDPQKAVFYAFMLVKKGNGGSDLVEAQTIADAYLDRLVLRAYDDNLDFANNNPTHGTFVRFPNGTETNPFFLTLNWMGKNMRSLTLLYDTGLFQANTSLTEANKSQIWSWLNDCYDWALGRSQNVYALTFGSGWETYSFTSNGYNTTAIANSTTTNPFIVESDGTIIPGYVMIRGQQTNFNNIAMKYAGFVHAYALNFNIPTGIEYSERIFKDYFRFHVLPDNTSVEPTRAYASNPSQGLQYWATNLATLSDIAYSHAVAVENGLITGDVGELFNWTTDEGFSTYGYPTNGTDTAGGNKGLKGHIEMLGEYLKQANNSPFTPTRHVNQSPYPLHAMPDRNHYVAPAAMANAYYQDADIEFVYKGGNDIPVPISGNSGGPYPSDSGGGFALLLFNLPYLDTEGIFNITGVADLEPEKKKKLSVTAVAN